MAIRIPHAFAREVQLDEGATVELTVAEGRLIITPHPRKYSLDQLVAEITPENRHPETDWGEPARNESW